MIPNPRLVLAQEGSFPGREILREHDCIMITAVSGSKYVLDVTAWQFGYGDYFFLWDKYKEKYTVRDTAVEFRIAEQEHDFVNKYYADSDHQKINLAFIRQNEDWVTNASEKAFKRAAKTVSLSLSE